MTVPQQLVYNDLPGTLPARYDFTGSQAARLSSVSARFNGAAASGSFVPALAVYSSDGRLIGRYFPSQTLASGDSGEVTFGPFLGRVSSTSPPSSTTPIWWAVSGGSGVSVASATPTDLALYGTGHSSSGTYYTMPTVTDKKAIGIKLPGHYLARASVLFAAAGAYNRSVETVVDTANPPSFSFSYDGDLISELAGATSYLQYWEAHFDIGSTETFPQWAGVLATHTKGVNVTCTGQLYLSRLGDATY